VCRSLFEAHKPLFSLLLAAQVFPVLVAQAALLLAFLLALAVAVQVQ
jgi:hypothetical protein